MIQCQILQIEIIGIVRQTVKRITNEILGVKGFRSTRVVTRLNVNKTRRRAIPISVIIIQNSSQHEKKKMLSPQMLKSFIPLTPMIDKFRISPYNITPESYVRITRVMELSNY